MLKKEIVDLQTGESVIEDLTKDELAVAAQMEKERLAVIAEAEQIQAERLKVIEKLGITADEAKLLFG